MLMFGHLWIITIFVKNYELIFATILGESGVARSSLMDLDPPRSIWLERDVFSVPLRLCLSWKPMLKVLATLYSSYRNLRRP